eukprot:104266_1
MGACCGACGGGTVPPETKPNIEKQAPPHFGSCNPQSEVFIPLNQPQTSTVNIIAQDETEDSNNTESPPPKQQNGCVVHDPNTPLQPQQVNTVQPVIPIAKSIHK